MVCGRAGPASAVYIEIIVLYSPTETTRLDILYNTMFDAGLVVKDQSDVPAAKPVIDAAVTKIIENMFKDTNNNFVINIIEASHSKWIRLAATDRGVGPFAMDDVDVAYTPCTTSVR